MQVNSPYKIVLTSELELGELVIVHKPGEPVLALTVAWPGGETQCLALEGSAAGTLFGCGMYQVAKVDEPVTLELPRGSRAGLSETVPKLSLSVAVGGDKTCFVFLADGKYHAADIETGVVSDRPSVALYFPFWEIWPANAKAKEAFAVRR